MGKRKHPPTASAPASAAPPRKKTRRSKPSEPNAGSDSDDSIEIIPSSQRKTKGPARRAVAADSEDEGVPQALATPRAKAKRVVVVASDSEDSEEQPRRKKRLRRGSSPVVDVEDDEEELGPSRGRLRRKQEVEDEEKYKLDSDDDLDDLLLPELPSSSKPTKKDARSSALQKYALARKNRSSPPPVPADAEKELDFEPFPEVDSDEEEQEDLEDDDNDDAKFASEFIVDEDDEDAAADATAELDRMRYTHRDLEENFGIFVEYMVLLNADPKWRETASEDDKEYYATAVAALRKNIEPLADTMLHTTWKAPFIATLQLRPVLQDGVSCDRTGNCHACWTRGMYSCDVSGSYELSTRKGTYDQDTFQKKKEVGLKYGTQTSFENNAEARNLPYPPKFKLYIGARCFKRATAYHEVRHCLYNYSVRVKERIEGLCEENTDLEDNVKAQLDALKEENFIDMLWQSFKFERNQWSRFANRKDPDVWG